jgi:hypothetical protein
MCGEEIVEGHPCTGCENGTVRLSLHSHPEIHLSQMLFLPLAMKWLTGAHMQNPSKAYNYAT